MRAAVGRAGSRCSWEEEEWGAYPPSTFLFCFGTGPYYVALANCVDQVVLELGICVTMPVFIVCFKY